MIHETAIVDAKAELGADVHIGPYSVIGSDVEIGDGTWVGSHVVINGPTKIGKENKIFQFSSIGEDPQDKKYSGDEDSVLVIGDRNLIREYCSINRGTEEGGGKTVIGNDNWIMAYVHIAHDCLVGNNTVFANNTTLAGHVSIDDFVILGGFTGVHQFCHIGKHCFTAISSVVVKDIPPFLMVSGNTAKPSGLNREGLKRYGFTPDEIDLLRRAYKVVYRNGLTKTQAIESLQELTDKSDAVKDFSDFLQSSTRGIAR